MMKQVAIVLALTPLVAHAEGSQTETADTLVVVTPNAPTIVVTGQSAAPNGAPGAAQMPGATEMPLTPPGAPQTEPWSDVSHINGQLVPVGERGAYLYRFRKTNIGVNPIGWMFGFYGASVQHAVSQNVAIRGDVSVWSIANDNFSGIEVSASAPIYFRRTYAGPFFEPGLVYHSDAHNYEYASYGDGYSGAPSNTKTWVGPQMMLGWSWIFDSGLNVAFAFGASKPISNPNMSSHSSDPYPAGYFRIGYAF
ncbi:MAG: hypothetical protein JWO36_6880 [Myxococcales bacterium]|nr:hypothetical protein [Myxococcales bacterium]